MFQISWQHNCCNNFYFAKTTILIVHLCNPSDVSINRNYFSTFWFSQVAWKSQPNTILSKVYRIRRHPEDNNQINWLCLSTLRGCVCVVWLFNTILFFTRLVWIQLTCVCVCVCWLDMCKHTHVYLFAARSSEIYALPNTHPSHVESKKDRDADAWCDANHYIFFGLVLVECRMTVRIRNDYMGCCQYG